MGKFGAIFWHGTTIQNSRETIRKGTGGHDRIAEWWKSQVLFDEINIIHQNSKDFLNFRKLKFHEIRPAFFVQQTITQFQSIL